MNRAWLVLMLVLMLVVMLVVACGTQNAADVAASDVPSAGMGPFRALSNQELKGTAPFVLDDARAKYTEPAALADADGVILYAVSDGTIVRTRSLDGRTFFGNGQAGKAPVVVLTADEPWEGGALSGPFAYRAPSSGAEAETLLYYAGRAGIGVARSTDGGLTFRKVPGPLLRGDLRAPTVFSRGLVERRMMFATAAGIEEARSDDGGGAWTRLGVVLAPAGGDVFDGARVGDPVATTRITPAGRTHVRVLYTGTSAAGATAIGFAARYGDDGPLVRNPTPTFPNAREPAYAPPLLYITQTRSTYPAIAAAVEPLDAVLEAPADFPPSP